MFCELVVGSSDLTGQELRARHVTTPTDDRSPTAKAYQWSSRIMVVSLEMILPGLAGYWVDRQIGTGFLFLLVGLVAGCTGAMWHLLRMTKAGADADKNRRDAENSRVRRD